MPWRYNLHYPNKLSRLYCKDQEYQKEKTMLAHYSNFYKDFHKTSKCYIPSWPFKTEADLGDLFIIRFGQMIKVGNIFDKFFGVYEEIHAEEEWQTSLDSWTIQSGSSHSYKSKSSINPMCDPCEKAGLKIEFNTKGDYFFDASEIKHRSIVNFYDFKFKLLQVLASEKFSFKEIFVATSIAKAETYSLMIASDKDAYTLISAEEEGRIPRTPEGLTKKGFAGDIQDMESMHIAHISDNGGPMFFKAQKMEASHQGKELVRKYIAENLPESVQKHAANIIEYAPTQVLPSADIFPTEVHELFDFREMNLNDISELFGEY